MITNSNIQFDSIDGLKLDITAFTDWNSLQEYLKDQGLSKAEIKGYYKQWIENTKKTKPLSAPDIRDRIKEFTNDLKKDTNGQIFRGQKRAFADYTDLSQFIESELEGEGCRFSGSVFQKELSAIVKTMKVYDTAFEVMSSVLAGEITPLPEHSPTKSWCTAFLRHFGFPYDEETEKRVLDFIKRQIERIKTTHDLKPYNGVNSMLIFYGEGNIGKSWMCDCLNRAAFDLETTSVQEKDKFSFYNMQIVPAFYKIEEKLDNFDDDELKGIITASKPIGRQCGKAVDNMALCRSSYIFTCNNLDKSFALLSSTTDTGMMRRFIVLKSAFKKYEKVERDWSDEEMIEVFRNVLREADHSQLLDRHEVERMNSDDFKKYIADDNHIIKRIKTAIKKVLEDHYINYDSERYPRESFRLWIERGNCPSGCNVQKFPEFEANRLTRTRLSKTEIDRIYDSKKELTLLEIGERINFNFDEYINSKTTINNSNNDQILDSFDMF